MCAGCHGRSCRNLMFVMVEICAVGFDLACAIKHGADLV